MTFVYNKPDSPADAFGLVDKVPSYISKDKTKAKADKKIQDLVAKKRSKINKIKNKKYSDFMAKKRSFDVSRGGYSVKPPTPRRPPIIKGGSFIRGSISKPASKIFIDGLSRVASKGFRNVASALAEEVVKQATIRGKYEIKRILNPPGLTGDPNRTVPLLSTDGVRMMPTVGTLKPKRSHRTKVQTGNPSSKTLLEIGKENGTEERVVFDSKMFSNPDQEGAGGSIMNRSILTNSCGFNLRNFFVLPAESYITQKDVINEASFVDNLPSDGVGLGTALVNASETTYASLLSTTTELQIYNQSRFLPAVFKIHIVCSNRPRFQENNENLLEPSQDIGINLIKRTDELGDGFPPVRRSGIPGYYLVEEPVFETVTSNLSSGTSVAWNQLTSGKGLLDSPYFRDNYTIVDTKQKTIEPNESWQFTHEHQYGGGVDFNLLTMNYNLSDNKLVNTPLSYFIIIETKGLPIEGVYFRPNDENQLLPEPRLGTSPVYYFVEFRKSMKFVRAESNTFEVSAGAAFSSGQFGGVPERRMHMRTFLKNERDFQNNDSTNRPFYRLPMDIGAGNSSEPGYFYIPMETDTVLTGAGAGTRSGAGDKDAGNR